MNLTDHEREALANFLADGGLVKSAIDKFLQFRQSDVASGCMTAIRALPRNFELAADYAAKGEVYKDFFADLQRFVSRNQST